MFYFILCLLYLSNYNCIQYCLMHFERQICSLTEDSLCTSWLVSVFMRGRYKSFSPGSIRGYLVLLSYPSVHLRQECCKFTALSYDYEPFFQESSCYKTSTNWLVVFGLLNKVFEPAQALLNKYYHTSWYIYVYIFMYVRSSLDAYMYDSTYTLYTYSQGKPFSRGLRNLPDDVVYHLLCKVKLGEVLIKSLNSECKKITKTNALKRCSTSIRGWSLGRRHWKSFPLSQAGNVWRSSSKFQQSQPFSISTAWKQ